MRFTKIWITIQAYKTAPRGGRKTIKGGSKYQHNIPSHPRSYAHNLFDEIPQRKNRSVRSLIDAAVAESLLQQKQ
ncbi:hypothetical protein C5167_026236 [Papaver somniferum]|nr:hypothetical protein C5167_026236 [Papaver somniferum]